jgi:hypothetical protein
MIASAPHWRGARARPAGWRGRLLEAVPTAVPVPASPRAWPERDVRAVVLRGPGRLEVADLPEPALAPGQVMVRVQACGICGSDLRYLHGENPWSQHTLGANLPSPPNMVLGHEFAGEIVRAADADREARLPGLWAVLLLPPRPAQPVRRYRPHRARRGVGGRGLQPRRDGGALPGVVGDGLCAAAGHPLR